MSQERGSTEHHERYPPIMKASVSREPQYGPSLPNTLPYSPHGFATAGASTGPLFPPKLPPFLKPDASFSSRPASLPAPPSFSLPPIGHFSTKPPRLNHRNSMTIGLMDDDDQVQKARAEAKAAKAQDRRSANPDVQNAPSFVSTVQPGQRRSRLPSNKIPRKMPLSADGRPPGTVRRNSVAQRPAERSKTNERRATKKALQNAYHPNTSESDSKRASMQNTHYTPTSGSDHKRGTPARQDTPTLDQPYLAPSASRNQRMTLDTDDEAAQPPSSNGAATTKSSSSPSTLPLQPSIPRKAPRPRHDYLIPENLRSTLR